MFIGFSLEIRNGYKAYCDEKVKPELNISYFSKVVGNEEVTNKGQREEMNIYKWFSSP